MLVRSIPDANAALASSPPRVELYFSETVALAVSNVKVLNASGKQVDQGDQKLDPLNAAHLLVSLPPLPQGVYLVVWRAISATDGHQTTGSFPFSVGNVSPGAMTALGSQAGAPAASVPLAAMLAKGFLYLAVATLLGGSLFTFLVWDPAWRETGLAVEDARSYDRFSVKLALAALLVLAVADIFSMMIQAGQVRGSLIGWPWQPEFAAVLTGTRIGALGMLRLGAVMLLSGLLLPARNKWNRWAGLVICLLLLLTFSLESHAAGNSRPILPVLADWVHLAAVSVWVGGLFAFLGGMLLIRRISPQARTQLTSLLIPHFTTLAMTSVGLLMVTGIYASVLDIGSLPALWTTPYGQALIVKLFIAAPMLGLGAFNFLFTTPAMRRAASKPAGSPQAVQRFQYLLTGEAFLGVVMLLWVGAFTSLPPAGMTTSLAGISKTVQANDLRITLSVQPGQPGLNTFTAVLTSGGKPVLDAQDVSLEFTSLSGMLPPSKAAMINLGNGRYSLEGGYLAMPDNWDIKVVVIRPASSIPMATLNGILASLGV